MKLIKWHLLQSTLFRIWIIYPLSYWFTFTYFLISRYIDNWDVLIFPTFVIFTILLMLMLDMRLDLFRKCSLGTSEFRARSPPLQREMKPLKCNDFEKRQNAQSTYRMQPWCICQQYSEYLSVVWDDSFHQDRC